MNNNLFVTKRNGEKEPIDLEKIHKVIDWAAAGLDNVSVSQVELKSHIQFYDGIKTEDIHKALLYIIKNANINHDCLFQVKIKGTRKYDIYHFKNNKRKVINKIN